MTQAQSRAAKKRWRIWKRLNGKMRNTKHLSHAEIIKEYQRGASIPQLAEKYGVTKSSISYILEAVPKHPEIIHHKDGHVEMRNQENAMRNLEKARKAIAGGKKSPLKEKDMVESIRLIKRSKLNLNAFAVVNGEAADAIMLAKQEDILALKIVFQDRKGIYGLQITKAEVFTREMFEQIIDGYW